MNASDSSARTAWPRHLPALSAETFDVLVVGGGIQGATIAWAAARRGLRTAAIDAADWGAGASANSLKIIHGGLRYLQHANLVRMRESIRARRRIQQWVQQGTAQARGLGVRKRGARGGWAMAHHQTGSFYGFLPVARA